MGLCYCLIQNNQHEVLKVDQITPTDDTAIVYSLNPSAGGNTHYARLAVRPIMDSSE